MATKKYIVYWIEKHDNAEWLRAGQVLAANAKEACQVVKRAVKADTGRNAFTPSTRFPLDEDWAHARFHLTPDQIRDRAMCRRDGFKLWNR